MAKKGRGITLGAGKPPCEPGCRGRRVGCHAVCEKYIAYSSERQSTYEMRAARLQAEIMLSMYSPDHASRSRKAQRRRAEGRGGW